MSTVLSNTTLEFLQQKGYLFFLSSQRYVSNLLSGTGRMAAEFIVEYPITSVTELS